MITRSNYPTHQFQNPGETDDAEAYCCTPAKCPTFPSQQQRPNPRHVPIAPSPSFSSFLFISPSPVSQPLFHPPKQLHPARHLPPPRFSVLAYIDSRTGIICAAISHLLPILILHELSPSPFARTSQKLSAGPAACDRAHLADLSHRLTIAIE